MSTVIPEADIWFVAANVASTPGSIYPARLDYCDIKHFFARGPRYLDMFECVLTVEGKGGRYELREFGFFKPNPKLPQYNFI